MKKLLNLLLLIGGYGLGQGAMFLAQTWLVGHGDLVRMAEFGLNFYLATLAILLVDFGSTAFLAREAAHQSPDASSAPKLWEHYWSIVPARVAVALSCIFAAAIYSRMTNAFSAAYLIFMAPGLLVWAFNFTGILDGLRMSGASGVTGALPFLASAIALVAASTTNQVAAGATLGASLSFGYALCVTLQAATLAKAGYMPQFVRPSALHIRNSAVHSGSAMLTLLPGQLYFRMQLLLSGVFMGAAGTALFLYAKQIVAACAQLIGFLRRVEFPDLVRRLSHLEAGPLLEILSAQRLGTMVAVVASLVTIIGGLTAHFAFTGTTSSAGLVAAAFAPTILTSALALSFVQGLMASRLFRSAAAITLFATAVSALFSLVAVGPLHHTGLAAADAIGNLVTIIAAVIILNRHYQAPKEQHCAS